MTTEEKVNIVSRRSFFRISGQIVLPILTLLIIPSCAPKKKLPDAPSTCRGTCTGTCTGLCAVACQGSCVGTCMYMCHHSTKKL